MSNVFGSDVEPNRHFLASGSVKLVDIYFDLVLLLVDGLSDGKTKCTAKGRGHRIANLNRNIRMSVCVGVKEKRERKRGKEREKEGKRERERKEKRERKREKEGEREREPHIQSKA